MNQNAPSLTALRALDAVLRLGSLSAAGRELDVTPAAISHRLRDLEVLAGQPLLWRNGSRFEATEAGAQVITALGDAFQRLREAGAVLRDLQGGTSVRVLAPMSFTILWLLPRLAGFETLYPDVTPYVAAARDPLRRDGPPPELRIAHGVDAPEGSGWEILAEDVTALTHAPGRFPEANKLLASLPTRRALHIDSPDGVQSGTLGWAPWMAAMGLAGPVPRGPHVSAEHAAADLAMQGEALMLASLFTLADPVAAGRLVVVPGTAVDVGVRYWLAVERPGRVAFAFADWLRAEVAVHRCASVATALAMVGTARKAGGGNGS